MIRKPEVKPTIRGINRHLVRFERDGHYTPRECMRQRGDWIKMMSRRRKRITCRVSKGERGHG